MGSCRIYRGIGRALMLAGLLAASVPAGATNPLIQPLEGAWSGSGTLKQASGETERIRCHGTARSVSENTLEQVFECASTGDTFDFSTSLYFSGSRVRGEWRAPDRSGTLSGNASVSRLDLRLSSQDGQGNLTATTTGCNQNLRVTGWSEDKRASLSLRLKKNC